MTPLILTDFNCDNDGHEKCVSIGFDHARKCSNLCQIGRTIQRIAAIASNTTPKVLNRSWVCGLESENPLMNMGPTLFGNNLRSVVFRLSGPTPAFPASSLAPFLHPLRWTLLALLVFPFWGGQEIGKSQHLRTIA